MTDTLTIRHTSGLTREVKVIPRGGGTFYTWYDRAHEIEMYPSSWRSLGWEVSE